MIKRRGIGADMVFLAPPGGVLPDRCLSCEQASDRFLCFSVAIGPERPRRIPEGGQSLAIGIAVLADNGLNPLWVFDCQAKSHRSPIILDIDAEALELERVEDVFHHLFEGTEGFADVFT